MTRFFPWLAPALFLASALIANPAAAQACAGESAQRSVNGGEATRVRFDNQRGAAVDVYWLDYEGHRRRYATLQPGESWSADTFLTHPWVVTDANTGRCLGIYLPLPNGAVIAVR